MRSEAVPDQLCPSSVRAARARNRTGRVIVMQIDTGTPLGSGLLRGLYL